jgi:hypothetical protein
VVAIRAKALPVIAGASDVGTLERRVHPWGVIEDGAPPPFAPGENPQSGSPDGATTTPWRCFLLEGAAFGATGHVNWWLRCGSLDTTEWLSEWRSSRGEKAQNLFFLGCPTIGYNSSCRVSVPSSNGTVPSNLGKVAGALFGDGLVVP